MVSLNRKGAIIFPALIVIALAIVMWQFFSIVSRECNEDLECGENRYCGSDYECHSFPTEVNSYDFTIAAIILGIAIIIAVIVYKRLPPKPEGHGSHGAKHH